MSNQTTAAFMSLHGCKTIPELLARTAGMWPDRAAYKWFNRKTEQWNSYTWQEFASEVERWKRAIARSGLSRGDRVAVLLTNSIEALLIDQAILACGLTPVPMHAIDTPAACAFILADSGARMLVSASAARWHAIRDADATQDLSELKLVVLAADAPEDEPSGDRRVVALPQWLEEGEGAEVPEGCAPAPEDLAALVYTSGTTGRPKGVMLPHRAIIANLAQLSPALTLGHGDVFLSYLPLSHAFERTVTYYYSLAEGAELVIARSIGTLPEDLQVARPTILCTVPRVLERFHLKILNAAAAKGEEALNALSWTQEVGWRRFCRVNDLPVEHTPREELDEAVWPKLNSTVGAQVRGLFGGRIRDLIVGGAALNYAVAKFYCSMDINLRQGYGLTESSPVISVSETPGNHPATVGKPLPGIEARLGPNDELQVRGNQIMSGYWKRPEATREAFTEDGFLRTGDQADLSDGGRIRIKGRIKEIIVTSTGEKIPPVDLEFAILEDPLFDQVMIVGEGRPFISALAVINPDQWAVLCGELGLDPADSASLRDKRALRKVILRIRERTRSFPQYGVPKSVFLMREPWNADNGLTTITLKLRRRQIMSRFMKEIDSLYAEKQA